VADGRTFLFASKDGFRFLAQPIGPEAEKVSLTLTRTDEAPERTLTTLPSALPHDEELALARRLLDPYAERVLKNQGDESETIRTLEYLAMIEPAKALEQLEGKTLNPYLKAMIQSQVAKGLLDEAPDEALALFESIENPMFRTLGLLRAADALPDMDRARKLTLLDQALVSGRTAKEPTGIRVLLLGQVAEHWLDLGLNDRAEELFRETQKEAEQLPDAAWAAYAKGAFAEELAQIDLKAALALTRGLTDPGEFDRHHGNIAHELAGRSPADAEIVLGMVREQFRRDQYAVRVVYRMATVDLDRARRIASTIKIAPLQGSGLGMMALALAESDRQTAESLLRDAYDVLDGAPGTDDRRLEANYPPAAIGSALLPVAERIDPKLVLEAIGRTLSLRPPVLPRNPDTSLDAQLALMIACYDRDLAKSLLDPLTATDQAAILSSQGPIELALAVIDPRRAVELIEALPDDPDLKPYQTGNNARLGAVSVLARSGERRWRYLQGSRLHLWVPDNEDLDKNY
jgi:hypothetical protein